MDFYDILLAKKLGGGSMPEGYPIETKELYNGTVNVPSGSGVVPLNLSNDDFDDWTVLINGNEAPKTFAEGCPAYGWFDDDYLGVVDATIPYGEGVIFISDSEDTDHTLVITKTITNPNFVEGVKNAIDELDYPFEHSQKDKYNETVTLTAEDDDGVLVDAIPTDADLTSCDIYVGDQKLTYIDNTWQGFIDTDVLAALFVGVDGYYFMAFTTDYSIVPGDYEVRVVENESNLNNRFNDGVNAVLSEYNLATPTVMKYEGDLVLTENDATVYIPFAQGTDLSDYEQWTVTVDGQELAWSGFDKTFFYEDSDSGVEYGVGDYMDDGYWSMSVRDSNH